MRAEFINPFLSAATEVFRTMLSCEVTRGAPTLGNLARAECEVSGLIGLSGSYQGMVVVSLGRETAIRVTEAMLGERPASVNADVADAVGEITNMIAGAAKAKLEEYRLSIGLPTIICGKEQVIAFPSCARPITLPFDSEYGRFYIEVGLVESAVLV